MQALPVRGSLNRVLRQKRYPLVVLFLGLLLLVIAGLGWLVSHRQSSAGAGIHKIKHVVIIMQENRSFDSYFGTYPGADGFPRKNGSFTACVPDPEQNTCLLPYHNHADVNLGGPHLAENVAPAVNGGKMNG
ncbi:MAG: hypothetical protein DLM70_17515, partial [Chloroflexi bacterium]